MLGGGRAKSAILYTYEGIAIEDVNGISPFTGASGADEPLKILRVEHSNSLYYKSLHERAIALSQRCDG